MKYTKLMLCAAALLACGAAFAQRFDDDFDSFDSFDSFDASSREKAVDVHGQVELSLRYFVDGNQSEFDSFGDMPLDVVPQGNLDFSYEGSKADVELKLAFNEDIIKNYPRKVIDELTMRAYLGSVTIEAGDMKVVWGKGDKLHVLDNFNANDYYYFLIPDYIDRRIAEPMVRVAWNCPWDFFLHSFRIEGIYTPMMTADRLGTGRWTPAQVTAITDRVTTLAGTKVATMQAEAIPAIKDSNPLAPQLLAAYTRALSQSGTLKDNLYPNTYRLKYGQAGIRMTGTIGIVDTGLSYYYGHYKQPSVDASKIDSYITRYLAGAATEDDKFLSYDALHVFGAEAGMAVGPVNLRAELAYYLTHDVQGTDAAVRNNSVNWLFGFDWNIPVSNLNVNVQTVGQYIVKNSEIKSNGALDTEYDANGIYSNNKIMLNISDSYNHEKIQPSVTFIYGIERGDFIIKPELTVNVFGGLDAIASGMYITHFYDRDKSEFASFTHNSFVSLGMRYTF